MLTRSIKKRQITTLDTSQDMRVRTTKNGGHIFIPAKLDDYITSGFSKSPVEEQLEIHLYQTQTKWAEKIPLSTEDGWILRYFFGEGRRLQFWQDGQLKDMQLSEVIRTKGFLTKQDKLNSLQLSCNENSVYRGCRTEEIYGTVPLGDCWTRVISVAQKYAEQYGGTVVGTPISRVLNSRKKAVGLSDSNVIWISPKIEDILEIDGKRISH